MTRAKLIERIQALSDVDLARVAPFLEADLDSLDDLEALQADVRLGEESAAREPLLDHDDVMKAALARVRG